MKLPKLQKQTMLGVGIELTIIGCIQSSTFNADDVVIVADLFDTLKEALFIFNEHSQKLGLHVNWSKTKLQSFSP